MVNNKRARLTMALPNKSGSNNKVTIILNADFSFKDMRKRGFLDGKKVNAYSSSVNLILGILKRYGAGNGQ